MDVGRFRDKGMKLLQEGNQLDDDGKYKEAIVKYEQGIAQIVFYIRCELLPSGVARSDPLRRKHVKGATAVQPFGVVCAEWIARAMESRFRCLVSLISPKALCRLAFLAVRNVYMFILAAILAACGCLAQI
jgi:hypothetical protein